MDHRRLSGRSLSGRQVSGREIGIRVSGGGVPGDSSPTPPAASVLTWNGDESDSRPDFEVDLPSGNGAPYDTVENDVLRIQSSSNGGSIWNAYLTRTITADDIAGDPFTVSSVSPLSNGDYLFRSRIERGSLVSAWSSSEAVTVNVVQVLPYFTVIFH